MGKATDKALLQAHDIRQASAGGQSARHGMVVIVKRQRNQANVDIRMQLFITGNGGPNGGIKVRVGGDRQRGGLCQDGN
ncbi:hypothetical protein GCM10027295_19750 [Pseudaeromonas pectinilytica]